jgi:hypothetical protein
VKNAPSPALEETAVNSTARIVLLVILVVLLISLLPAWPYSSGFGYYPAGGLGLILVVVLVLLLLGKL